MTPNWQRVAIDRTILYAKVFGADISLSQLERGLISSQRMSRGQIAAELQKSGKMEAVKEVPFFAEKWRSVSVFVRIMHHIPWIEAIFVTGALGAGTPQADDDIDFLIITSPNRLWLVRFLVVLIGTVLGKYRNRHTAPTKIPNSWCCNLWLETSELGRFAKSPSLYIARELVQAVPVYARAPGAAEAFLQANPWVRNFCANGFALGRGRARAVLATPPLFSSWLAWRGLNRFWLGVNHLLRVVQFSVIFRHKTRETVERSAALFHPRDTHHWVIDQFTKLCKQKKIQPWDGHQVQ